MNADVSACLSSWADELHSRANRVRQLIADKHWLSDGKHKEAILREFLSRHLSPALTLSGGFICPLEHAGLQSGEIDLILSDHSRTPPWFNEGGLLIASPHSVLAHIHVKSTFTANSLQEAFTSVATAYAALNPFVDIGKLWSGIFFFDPKTEGNPIQFEATVRSALRSTGGAVRSVAYLPDCLCLSNGLTALIKRNNKAPSSDNFEWTTECRAFSTGGLSPAVFLAHLSEALAREKGQDPIFGTLQSAIERSGVSLVHRFTVGSTDS